MIHFSVSPKHARRLLDLVVASSYWMEDDSGETEDQVEILEIRRVVKSAYEHACRTQIESPTPNLEELATRGGIELCNRIS